MTDIYEIVTRSYSQLREIQTENNTSRKIERYKQIVKEYTDENVNEIIICISRDDGVKIYEHMSKNEEINYNVLFHYTLYSCEFHNGEFKHMYIILKKVYTKIELKNFQLKDVELTILIDLLLLKDEELKEYIDNAEDKDVFNRAIKDKKLSKFHVLKYFKYATDKDVIDNILLKFTDDFHLLNDVNRELDLRYMDYDLRYYELVNKYGLLLVSVCDIGDSDKSPRSNEVINILINKGGKFKQLNIDEKDKRHLIINIDSLKLLESCENFDDFVQINKRFILNSLRTDEEMNYILSII